jgi:hypothetical protein
MTNIYKWDDAKRGFFYRFNGKTNLLARGPRMRGCRKTRPSVSSLSPILSVDAHLRNTNAFARLTRALWGVFTPDFQRYDTPLRLSCPCEAQLPHVVNGAGQIPHSFGILQAECLKSP